MGCGIPQLAIITVGKFRVVKLKMKKIEYNNKAIIGITGFPSDFPRISLGFPSFSDFPVKRVHRRKKKEKKEKIHRPEDSDDDISVARTLIRFFHSLFSLFS